MRRVRSFKKEHFARSSPGAPDQSGIEVAIAAAFSVALRPALGASDHLSARVHRPEPGH
jgi:hypothetical protein